MIDLRSDTVTRPGRAMREAMAAAEVGDDVFGEDPTLLELEREVSALLGKEAALFVPSGTMANQLAIMAQTQRGDEIIVGEGAHCAWYETGAAAALSGVQAVVVGNGGRFIAEDVAHAMKPSADWYPRTSLVALENSHNRGGGSVWRVEHIDDIAEVCRAKGLRLHMDGARLWNAAVATGCSEARIVRDCDSVSVCFSKGLGAPVGSALCGRTDLVVRARRFRKMLGGGMRQAGILAAAALYAIRHHRKRIAEDHENARHIAATVEASELRGVRVSSPETNIVMIDTAGTPAEKVVEVAKRRGVLVSVFGPERVRVVTHMDIASHVEQAALSLRDAIVEAVGRP